MPAFPARLACVPLPPRAQALKRWPPSSRAWARGPSAHPPPRSLFVNVVVAWWIRRTLDRAVEGPRAGSRAGSALFPGVSLFTCLPLLLLLMVSLACCSVFAPRTMKAHAVLSHFVSFSFPRLRGHGLLFWKEVIRELVHSMGMPMVRDKTLGMFVRDTLQRDMDAPLKVRGDNDVNFTTTHLPTYPPSASRSLACLLALQQ